MNEDPRCCGSGTCIIDTEGRCWCGQRWDGEKMNHAPLTPAEGPVRAAAARLQRRACAEQDGQGPSSQSNVQHSTMERSS